MKKLLTVLLTMLLVLTLAGCGQKEEPVEELTPEPITAKNTYAEYMAGANDDEFELLMSVQGHQNWWYDDETQQGKVTVYAQDDNGGYFIYEMICPEEKDADVLLPGTLIRVTGYKSEWGGEIELVDATYEFCDVGGNAGKVYPAKDVTSEVGTDLLINDMNKLVSIKGLTVVAYEEGSEEAISRKESSWDHDLYFKADLNGNVVEFCIENQLTAVDDPTYTAVENLKVGDVIDIEGFLYWYNGPNPHVTSITVK